MSSYSVFVALAEEKYASPEMVKGFESKDDALAYVESHVDDMDEWIEWEDGGGIIWQSNVSHVDGYSIRHLEVEHADE